MTTFLAQNQFITNSVAQPPGSVAADTAAAPPQPPGAAAGPIPEPSMTMEVNEAPAGRAPNTATPAGAFGVIDCINEIFFYARKLMKDDPGFVLDEGAFMAAIDEEPLFIREGGYLRRNA